MPWTRLIIALLLALRAAPRWAVLFLLACTPARREVGGMLVRHIKFEGNGGALSGQGDYSLRGQMEQAPSGLLPLTFPFMYLAEASSLELDLLPLDAYRLEVWYAHHGWFDAQVLGWQARRVRQKGARRAGVVDLFGVVEAGPASLVRSFQIEGLEGSPKLLASSVRRQSDVQPNSQFNLDYVKAARADLLAKLADHGFPYATVGVSIEADPQEEAVDVTFQAEAGQVAVYGPVTVVGLDTVPESVVRNAVPFLQTGEGYKQEDLSQAQRQLFDLGTFAIVDVEPDLSDPTRAEVPIALKLTETRFRTLRLGAGVDYDGFYLQPRVSARFKHVNLFHQLLRFDIGAQAGFAYISDESLGDDAFYETYALDAALSYPRLANQRVTLSASGGIEQDVQAGLFAFRRPVGDLQLLWKPPSRPKGGGARRELQLRVGPHVEEYRYLQLTTATEIAARRLFGESFENPYRLLALDQFFSYDTRDDKVFSTRGSYFTLGLREAFPFAGSNYAYLGASSELRRFQKIKIVQNGVASFPLVAAGRLRGTVLQPYGQGAVPYPEFAFQGGAGSVRGFRTNQVGPYDTLCVTDGETGEVTYYHLPRGGQIAGEGSAELRYDWAYGIKLASFLDGGLLSGSWQELSLDQFRWSGGVGFRYDTVVGPFRFDLSFRRLYPEDLAPSGYTRCAPEERATRPYDFFSAFERYRGTLDRPPFAMVFFLAIGESL